MPWLPTGPCVLWGPWIPCMANPAFPVPWLPTEPCVGPQRDPVFPVALASNGALRSLTLAFRSMLNENFHAKLHGSMLNRVIHLLFSMELSVYHGSMLIRMESMLFSIGFSI